MRPKPTAAELNKSRLVTDQVIAEVTQDIMSKQVPDDFDTLIVKKINVLCSDCFDQFRRMHNLQTMPMRKTDAIQHIRKLYKDKLATWTKDELLESMALIQATLGAEAFHDELI
jgi:hypothetical protein